MQRVRILDLDTVRIIQPGLSYDCSVCTLVRRAAGWGGPVSNFYNFYKFLLVSFASTLDIPTSFIQSMS